MCITHIHTHRYTHAHSHTHIYIHRDTLTHRDIHIYIVTHTYTHIHIHRYTYTHTHIYPNLKIRTLFPVFFQKPFFLYSVKRYLHLLILEAEGFPQQLAVC